jgi:hypothetical protein
MKQKFKNWLYKTNPEGVNNFDVIALFVVMPTLFYILCRLVCA